MHLCLLFACWCLIAQAANLAEASISCSIAVNSSSSLNLNEQFDAGCASAAWLGLGRIWIGGPASCSTIPKGRIPNDQCTGFGVFRLFESWQPSEVLGEEHRSLGLQVSRKGQAAFKFLMPVCICSWSLFTVGSTKDRNPRWLASLCM